MGATRIPESTQGLLRCRQAADRLALELRIGVKAIPSFDQDINRLPF